MCNSITYPLALHSFLCPTFKGRFIFHIIPPRLLALILCHSLPPRSSFKGFQIALSFRSGFQDQPPNIRPLTQYLPTMRGQFPSFPFASFTTTQYLSPKVSGCKGYRASPRKVKFSLETNYFLDFLITSLLISSP